MNARQSSRTALQKKTRRRSFVESIWDALSGKSGGETRRGAQRGMRFEPLESRQVMATTIGLNFTASTFNVDTTFIPPDTMGAVGPNHIVEMINGNFQVFNKTTGASLETRSLDNFWTAKAGATIPSGGTFDPRVIFDPSSGVWFATSINGGAGNTIFIARSDTADPTGDWDSVQFIGDTSPGAPRFNDYDTLGVDADALYIATNNFNVPFDVSVFSLPKAGLLAATPTLANMTRFEAQNAATRGSSIQGTINFGVSDGSGTLLGTGSGTLIRTNVVNPANPAATLTAPITITGVPAFVTAPAARQPNSPTLENVSPRFTGNVVEINGFLWAAHPVQGSAGTNSAVRWYQIDATTNAVVQTGLIEDTATPRDFFDPSIAVNKFGNVVIGYTGSGPTTFASSYASVGQTVRGSGTPVTTFAAPLLLRAGAGNYFQDFGSGRNRWGDYSATNVDPSAAMSFWTFQQFVATAHPGPVFSSPGGAYGVGVTALSIASLDYVIDANALGNNIIVRTDATGAEIEIVIDGVVTDRFSKAAVNSLTVNGLGGDDTLTVEYANGNPVPAGGFTFNGGANNDTLRLQGGAFTTITKNFTNATDGNINLDGGVINYTGLAPVLMNVGTVADIVFNLPAGPSNDVVIGNDTNANFPGLGLAVANTSAIDAATFEYTTFTNPTNSLRVNLGPNGDTIRLEGMDAGFSPGGATPFLVQGGNGADTIQVNRTTVATTLNGGLGGDTFHLSNPALVNGLDGLPRPVVVNGEGGTDVVTLNDQNSNFDDTYTITSTTVTRFIFGGLTYGTIESLTLHAQSLNGFGSNNIFINSTAAGTPVTVNANDGNDTVTVGNGTLDNILSTVTVNGNNHAAGDTLIINDSTDATGNNYTISPTQVTRAEGGVTINYTTFEALALNTSTAADTINVTPSIGLTINIDGNNPTTTPGDVLNYNGSGNKAITGQGSGVIDDGPGGVGPVVFQEVETVAATLGNTLIDTIDLGLLTNGNDGQRNTLRVVRNGANIEFYYDSDGPGPVLEVLLLQQLFASTISPITVTGSNVDADTLIVDHTGGFINRTFNFAGGGPVNMGEPNGDAVEFRGGVVNNETYRVGATEDAGTWVQDPDGTPAQRGSLTPGADGMVVNFTGLEPASSSTVATFFDVVYDAADADQLSIVNGGLLNGFTSLQVNDLSGTFETFRFANKTTVSLHLNRGADIANINYTTPAAGLTTLEVYGNGLGTVAGVQADDNSNDVFALQATGAGVAANNLFGQGGNDDFANVSPVAISFSMQGFDSPVVVDGGTGTDRLALSAFNDPALLATVTATTLSSAAFSTFTYSNLDSLLFAASQNNDTIDVLSTQSGTQYILGGDSGNDSITIGNTTANFTAPNFNGSLAAIQGPISVLPEFYGNLVALGVDTLNVDASGDAALAGAAVINRVGVIAQTYLNSGGANVSADTTRLSGFAAANIEYAHANLTDSIFGPNRPNRLSNLNVRGSQGGDNISVLATTAVVQTTVDSRQGNDAVTIAGDNLSANNTFLGFDGVDEFVLNVAANLGQTAFAPIQSVLIDGQLAAATSTARDRLTINDNNLGFARDLNYDYTDTAGGLNIAPTTAGGGLAGGVAMNLAVQTLGLETVIFNAPGGNNDAVRVTGTSGDDVIAVGLLASTTSATVFLNGNPYLGTPPETLANSRPGVSGGGNGPDILINGITALSGIQLFGDGNTNTAGQGDRAVVYASSEAGLNTGNGEDIFQPNGFAAGELIPGYGAGNAFDTIGVNGFFLGTTATPVGATDVRVFNGVTELMPVFVNDASFTQVGAPAPQQQAAIIVNAGDEPSFGLPQIIADNIFVNVSTNFNIRVNGNLPPLQLGPNGLPIGDQLNIFGPGDVNIFSDKAAPPNVTITFSLNPTPFGVQYSSIERLLLTPSTGVVNLIGDNNDPNVDQNDNFVVVGRDIDAGNPFPPADDGVNEMTVVINGSAPILLDGVRFLNVFGDDQNPPPGTPSNGNDIDTLEITPYADDTPRGWGIDVAFNEGNPAGADGEQADLLIVHTSLFGGMVSENIVIKSSGPDNGEVVVTNGSFGTPIVDIDFVGNTDIIVLDDDGFLNDTDTLTLRGTSPSTVQASGNDQFDINANAAQTALDPFVTVTDIDSGLILYRLRGFTPSVGLQVPAPIITLNFEGLEGNDIFNLVGPGALLAPFYVNAQANFLGGAGNDSLNIDLANGQMFGGSGIDFDGGTGSDLLTVTNTAALAVAITSTTYTPGAALGAGQLVYADGVNPNMVVDFFGLEPVVDLVVAANLIVNANGASNAINYGPGANPANGLVSIDNHETIEFANKTVLTINALAGDDVINLNNPNTPTGLGVGLGVGVPAIIVNGGDPTASDKVILNGTAGVDNVTVATLTNNSALVTGAGPVVIAVNTTEGLTYEGQGGFDNLTYQTPVGIDLIAYTPGAAPDAGTITANAIVNPLLGLQFANLGGIGGTVKFTDAGGPVGGVDSLEINGTANADQFNLGVAPNTVQVFDALNIFPFRTVPIFTPGVFSLTLHGLDGDDVFNVPGNHGYGRITVQGGNPSSGSDVLNFAGSGAAGGVVTVNYGAATVTETGNAPVAYLGIEVINANDGGQNGVVTATFGDDVLDVTPTAAGAATFRLTSANPSIGGAPVVNFFVAGTLTADGGLGTNGLTFNGTAGADAIAVSRTVGALSLQNGATQQILATNTFASWTVKGGDSNDAFTINETAGAGVISPIELNLEGGAGTNSLTYNSGVNQTYVPAGGLAGSFTGAAAATNYTNLATANVVLAGAATTGAVQANGAANQITVNGTAAGVITAVVDGGTLVTYSGTVTTLNVNAGAGDDVISVTPGLFAGAGGINVAGADPTASDAVIVAGTAGADNVNIDQITASGARITGAGAAVVTVATTESLTYQGQGGADTLTYTSPAGNDNLTYTPGADFTRGAITGHPTSGPFVSLLPVAFSGIGNVASGALVFADAGGARTDYLSVTGTSQGDLFNISSAGAGFIRERSTNDLRTLVFTTPGIQQLHLLGLAGDDLFQIAGNHPFTQRTGLGAIVVEGGTPDAGSDVLEFTGGGAAVTADYGLSTITETGFGPVAFLEIEIINASTAGGNLTINDTAGNDVFDVTPTGVNAVTTRLTSTNPVVTNTPVINGTNIGVYLLNAINGDDKLKVRYGSASETIDVNATAGTVNVTVPAATLEQVTFTTGAAGLNALEVFGNEGNDTFNVTPSANTTIFIDGGDPIGITGDTIIINGGVTLFKPGPESDEGGFQVGGNALISFDHIEAAIVLGAPCAIVTGTNADDDITVIARGANFNALADGVQDFTVTVNAGLEVLYIGTAMLGIDALSGDDDIVIRAPADPADNAWNVQVTVVGGSPSIGDPSEADRLVLETPFADNITYTPNGPDTATIGINAGNTGGLITILSALPAGFCPGIVYNSSVGGIEVIQYDGELAGVNGGTGAVVDTITINGSAAADTTTINAGGIGSGTFRSSQSPLFDFRSFTTVTVNGGAGGADIVVINGTEGADTFTSPAANQVALTGGVLVNLTANGSLDRMELFTFGGNDTVTLQLLEATLAKVVDAGAGNDTINMLASADGTFFGGSGDDTITGTPAADLIFGGSGNDILIGAGGADTIYGEDGNDLFGNPTLAANGVADDAGNDALFGGAGSDTFVWEPGDGSDIIEGGADESDVMLFFGNAAANAFILSAVATRLELNFGAGAVLMSAAGVEEVDVRGLAGADTFTVNDLFPTDVRTVTLDLAVEAGVADTVTVAGRNVSDNVNIAQTTATRVSVTGLRYDVRIDNAIAADNDILNLNGNDGNDTIVAQDALTTAYAAANLRVNGGNGDDFISGHGTLSGDAGNDTLVGGAAGQTINGGTGNDQIFGGDGDDSLFGNAGEDTFVGGLGNDTIDGGGDWDTILVSATSANDRIDVRQNQVVAGISQLLYEISNQFTPGVDGLVGGAGTETDNLVANAGSAVEEVLVVAGSGDDQIRATHNDLLISLGQQAFSVRMTIDGGAPGASDRLTVQDDGIGDTTIQRIGGVAGSGSFQVGALAPVVYVDVEYASLNPVNSITGATGSDSNGRLIVFPFDPREQNQTLTNATFLGNGTANLTGTIDPGVDAAPGFGIAGDEDWFRVVAPVSGVLDFQVYFNELAQLANTRAGLPGNGNLDIGVYDADGLVNGNPLAIGGFGTFGANDGGAELDTSPLANERVRIPAVAGQTYYIRIGGAAMLQNGTPNTSPAVNVYNLSVVSTAAPVSRDLELDDVIAQSTVLAAPAPTATSFTAPAAGLSATAGFYVGKFVYFTSGPLNGQRGVVTAYNGAGAFTFAAGTFTGAPAAGDAFQVESVDSGRSQLDNVTRDNTPTIFLRLDDAFLLNDIPGNPAGQTNAPPPDQIIPITYQINGSLPATPANQGAGGFNPGFRIAIFDETDTHNPVNLGYATPVVGAPGVYTFTFTTALSDGSHFITAKVEMIDPADTTAAAGIVRATGFGAASQSLEIVVDTAQPPVSFGQPSSTQAGREFTLNDGLHPDSDSGVLGMPASFNDNITNVLTPKVFGTAEANSIVRVYIDNLNTTTYPGTVVGAFDVFDVLGAQTVASPLDGTNQLPTGRWDTELTVSLNDQRFFPNKDGVRTLFVTAEDASGNVRPVDPLQIERLNLFVDTQGPQVTDVRFNSVTSTYNVFDHKNEGLPQGPGEPGTLVPTPVVNSIIVKLQDLPARAVNFFYQAIKTNTNLVNQANGAIIGGVADLPLGLVTLTGDAEGIIPIRRVTFTADQDPNTVAIDGFGGVGAIARGYLTITFGSDPDGVPGNADDISRSLPDDRFTLTVSDSLQDPVGNKLDGETQTDEPHDQPRFPSGDGIPGADFVSRFTVDSRPEVGTWAAGSVYIDINGNELWDPTNPDFTNRDIAFVYGYTADDIFAGNFSLTRGSVADGFDKLGAYGRVNGQFRWLIDTDNDGVPNLRVNDPANFNGLPAAGDFDGMAGNGDEVAVFNGTTWMLDTNHDYRLDTVVNWPGAPGGYPVVGDFDGDNIDDLGAWNDDFFRIDLGNNGYGQIDVLPFRFGFIGVGDRPVAADMNQDGIDDLGLWVPARGGVLPQESGEFFFLVSGAVPNDDANGPAVLGPSVINRIVIDSITGERVVRFQPVPFGNDLQIQFGDEFALPIVGNFDPPPVTANTPLIEGTNPRDALDVNNDGFITGLDALIIVDRLNTGGPGLLEIAEFPSAPFYDVNGDGYVTGLDALIIADYLNIHLLNGEGEDDDSGSALDDGEGESLDDLIGLLASGDDR